MLGLPSLAQMQAEAARQQAAQAARAAAQAAKNAAAPPPLSAGMFAPNIDAIKAWQAAQTPVVTPQPTGGGGGGGGSTALTPEQIAAIGASNAQAALAAAQLKALNDAKEAKLNSDLAAFKGMVSQYNMEKLWAGAEAYIRQGYTDQDTILQMLSNNAEYQAAYFERFPAVKTLRELNPKRIAAGLPPIAEPTAKAYTALEKSYRIALTGLPDGDFGNSTDIATWIVNDVSPDELAARATQAKNYINYQANGSIKAQLRSIYGMTDSQMAAYILDPERTSDKLKAEYNKRMAQATVGGAAVDAGLDLASETRDMIAQNESFGSSYANSLSQMQQVNQDDDAYNRLGRLSGVSTTTDELVTEQFGLKGAEEVSKKKKSLASQERARFSGTSAISKSSLSAGRLAQ